MLGLESLAKKVTKLHHSRTTRLLSSVAYENLYSGTEDNLGQEQVALFAPVFSKMSILPWLSAYLTSITDAQVFNLLTRSSGWDTV